MSIRALTRMGSNCSLFAAGHKKSANICFRRSLSVVDFLNCALPCLCARTHAWVVRVALTDARCSTSPRLVPPHPSGTSCALAPAFRATDDPRGPSTSGRNTELVWPRVSWTSCSPDLRYRVGPSASLAQRAAAARRCP
jgi:hypothetical protein